MRRRTLVRVLVGVAASALVSLGAQAADTGDQKSAATEDVKGSDEARAAPQGAVDDLDAAQQVLSRVHRVNTMTIEAGELAQKNARSEKVKALAKDVADTQKKWDAEVTSVAKEADVELVEPTPLDDQDRVFMSQQNAVMAQLRDSKGADFDKLYLKALIARRDNVLDVLEQLQPRIIDQEVKAAVAKSIRTFKDQRDRAATILKQEYPGA